MKFGNGLVSDKLVEAAKATASKEPLKAPTLTEDEQRALKKELNEKFNAWKNVASAHPIKLKALPPTTKGAIDVDRAVTQRALKSSVKAAERFARRVAAKRAVKEEAETLEEAPEFGKSTMSSSTDSRFKAKPMVKKKPGASFGNTSTSLNGFKKKPFGEAVEEWNATLTNSQRRVILKDFTDNVIFEDIDNEWSTFMSFMEESGLIEAYKGNVAKGMSKKPYTPPATKEKYKGDYGDRHWHPSHWDHSATGFRDKMKGLMVAGAGGAAVGGLMGAAGGGTAGALAYGALGASPAVVGAAGLVGSKAKSTIRHAYRWWKNKPHLPEETDDDVVNKFLAMNEDDAASFLDEITDLSEGRLRDLKLAATGVHFDGEGFRNAATIGMGAGLMIGGKAGAAITGASIAAGLASKANAIRKQYKRLRTDPDYKKSRELG